MSEAIRFCRSVVNKLKEEYDEKLITVPKAVVNEELQKKQFGEYGFWFDTNGYLFYSLPTIDFSAPTFEKMVEVARRFEPNMHIPFSDFTNIDNEKGIEFKVRKLRVVLLHDRFSIYSLNEILLGESPPIEELADALVKFYVKYGDKKKITVKLDKTKSIIET